MIDYTFSKDTFPLYKELEQHSSSITPTDILFECTLLAGKILGVECNDTKMEGDPKLGKGHYFQITPDPYAAKTTNEIEEYEGFVEYFYANYGIHENGCYFTSEYEAFYNLLKAWKIWREILAEDEKMRYLKNL